MKKLFAIVLSLCFVFTVWGQKIVTFTAADGLSITADVYETFEPSNKYMLLFHQAECSRGEFQQIAKRLVKLDYNCVAVDLRYGNEVNFINNETAMLAKSGNYAVSMLDCEKDILAAINYVRSENPNAELFLLGSSFSGSLCLKVAVDSSSLFKAVIAYSPGEYFGEMSMAEYVKPLQIPLYVACNRNEYSYVSAMVKDVATKKKVVFRPEKNTKEHGAKSLWWESDGNESFWLSLLFFLKDFK
ncbi:MAG: alpha/beta hydrolase [Bacteroidales bacterium]|nr:alpha/beta hydrolase [Bacteroidales bacterium]